MYRLLIPTFALFLSSTAMAVPAEFTHQGRLMDALGAPLTGFNSIAFSIHDSPAGGAALWAETQTREFNNGYYEAILGTTSTLDASMFANDELYLGIAVNGGPQLTPRKKLGSVPWALWAENAETATNVSGGIVNATEIQINGTTVIDSSGTPDVDWSDLTGIPADFADGIDDGGTFTAPNCSIDDVMMWDGSAWSCQLIDAHDHDAAQITTGFIDIGRIPVGGGNNQVAAGDHLHAQYADAANTLQALSCADGEVTKWNAGSSAWECASDSAGGGGALLANFELNEAIGSTFADNSGSGNDAIAPGGGFSGGSTGHTGTAIKFSGGVITVGAGNTIGDSPYISAEAWVRPDLPISGDKTVLLKEGAYRLTQAGDKIEFEVDAVGGSCTVTSLATISAGTWYHIQGTYNGRAITVSVDDFESDAICTNGALASTVGDPLHIGGDGTGGSVVEAYEGNVDEVRIWSQAASGFGFTSNVFELLAPTSCPSGMIMGGQSGTESAFCIEANERSADIYQNAMTICAQAGRHVCTTNQWYIGSQTSGVNGMCNSNWEWTGSKDHAHTSGYLQIQQGGAECTRKTWAWTDQHNNGTSNAGYRCCLGGLSSIFE